LFGVAADRRAYVEDDDISPQGRPDGGNSGPGNALYRAQAECRHGHQSAGVPTGDCDVGLTVLHRLEGHPHRGFAPALAEGLGRLFVHRNNAVGMQNPADLLEVWESVEDGGDLGFASVKQERRVAQFAQSERGTFDRHLRADIAAHGVDRYADCICHAIRFEARNATAAPP
jgi:hypothetical protein